ncbi:MAG: nucleoside phosphorylase [Saprospiraceae bacterium]|jgi:uridine phosphorylase|uniref:nucleoside phosphorylase n=1 Tax=Candidatus Brachybacter algidus TaxID=2982024 RepID=UPI001B65E049|nr:nucleoside phosphorylase [Candidatus Brachybacter algidus]MBP7539142.1 nucleoside phosphorylase [Saprospiraceae bacterium]MBK6448418.1 nucleoside phosphorylase [Candidatus Brachybacter algidus]MBK7603910.1 nucleoside phosphorylase [Candidatus Brachybacter algidus]MBK8749665.1 nucleoside phosphorylase [Candidatus Brachybacter algidus]MBL0118478.1 nucleoside phosphorylase [Candidatus Brachybacter algidus]
MPIAPSELILTDKGSIYHLDLRPEQIATTIITVGDPDRVELVSRYFDRVDYRVQHREFVTHTGMLGSKRISVLSTGIGTDNIDIVLNELDALVNVDFEKREIKKEKISLDIIRIGTSGTIRSEIEIDQIILSKGAIGLDGLMHFYERETDQCEDELLNWDIPWPIKPYMTWGSKKLLDQFSKLGEQAITISSTGFYGPQNRMIRLKPKVSNFFELLDNQIIDGSRIGNLEMETSGLYGLSEILGHECISINAIIANRALGVFSKDPAKTVKRTIESALGLI